MFAEMRRKDCVMEDTEAKKILEEVPYGVLATVGSNGYPYSIPISYVYQDGKLYFHCANKGQKIENIENCEKVSMSFVLEQENHPSELSTGYKCVVIYGICHEVFDEEKLSGLMGLINKYSADYVDAGKAEIEKDGWRTRVFAVTIDHMSGKWHK